MDVDISSELDLNFPIPLSKSTSADKFLESKHRRFPILENGKLVGQISQKDVLKAALKLNGQTWK